MSNILLSKNLKEEIIANHKDYICEENFVGIGTCRVSYKINNDLVLKLHLNDLGYQQSKTEYEIYNSSIFSKYKNILTKQMYLCKEFSICEYVEPLERYSDGGEIWCSDEIPFTYCDKELEEFFECLLDYDSDMCIDDLLSSNNIGVSKNKHLVFLDYGSKNNDYDKLCEFLEDVGESLLEDIKKSKDYHSIEKYVSKAISLVNESRKWIKLYHVSLKSNLEAIMKYGLVPKIGERSMEIGEKEKAIYLFPTIEDMECALGQWLGDWYNDEYGEDVPLMSLEITVPENFPIENGEVEYEKISKCTIHPKYINYLKDE